MFSLFAIFKVHCTKNILASFSEEATKNSISNFMMTPNEINWKTLKKDPSIKMEKFLLDITKDDNTSIDVLKFIFDKGTEQPIFSNMQELSKVADKILDKASETSCDILPFGSPKNQTTIFTSLVASTNHKIKNPTSVLELFVSLSPKGKKECISYLITFMKTQIKIGQKSFITSISNAVGTGKQDITANMEALNQAPITDLFKHVLNSQNMNLDTFIIYLAIIFRTTKIDQLNTKFESVLYQHSLILYKTYQPSYHLPRPVEVFLAVEDMYNRKLSSIDNQMIIDEEQDTSNTQDADRYTEATQEANNHQLTTPEEYSSSEEYSIEDNDTIISNNNSIVGFDKHTAQKSSETKHSTTEKDQKSSETQNDNQENKKYQSKKQAKKTQSIQFQNKTQRQKQATLDSQTKLDNNKEKQTIGNVNKAGNLERETKVKQKRKKKEDQTVALEQESKKKIIENTAPTQESYNKDNSKQTPEEEENSSSIISWMVGVVIVIGIITGTITGVLLYTKKK